MTIQFPRIPGFDSWPHFLVILGLAIFAVWMFCTIVGGVHPAALPPVPHP